MQRRWNLLQVALGAGFALLARRFADRAWVVMTGEEPPIRGHAGKPANELPREKSDASDSSATNGDTSATPHGEAR